MGLTSQLYYFLACATLWLSESQFPHLQDGAASATLREPGAGQQTLGGQQPVGPRCGIYGLSEGARQD